MGPQAVIPPRDVRLAAAAYPVEALPDLAAVEAKLTAWVGEAAGQGADLLVFPEYAGMEPTLTADRPGPAPDDWCIAAAGLAGWYHGCLSKLASRYGVHVLAGSLPMAEGGKLYNRTMLIAPNGSMLVQDKQILTPWERLNTPLSPARAATGWSGAFGRIGVLICYDAEFPTLTRRMAADILLVPSCTDTAAGAARVTIACRARALEGQAVVVSAPLLGGVPGCPLVDANTGRAGIYVAPDNGLPDDGILAEGEVDRPGWVCADLPRGLLSATRSAAAVNVPGDWPGGVT